MNTTSRIEPPFSNPLPLRTDLCCVPPRNDKSPKTHEEHTKRNDKNDKNDKTKGGGRPLAHITPTPSLFWALCAATIIIPAAAQTTPSSPAVRFPSSVSPTPSASTIQPLTVPSAPRPAAVRNTPAQSSAFYTPPSAGASSSFYNPPVGANQTLYGASPLAATSALETPVFDAFLPVQSFVAGLLQNPLQWGPFAVRPHVNYGFTYATGLPFAGEDGEAITHALSPGVSLRSAHLTFDYTPTLSFYQKGRYEDSVNHNASMSARFGYGDWTFGLSHNYRRSSLILIETGSQTDTESHSTGVTASYRHSYRTSLDFSLSQSIQESSGFNSSKNWSSMNWVNYSLTSHTSIGFGLGGGYSDVEFGSDMTYEMIQGRVSWYPTERFSLSANGGVQIRQFLATASASDMITPIMGASIGYSLFDHTRLSATANRSVNTSLFRDQVTENTSFSLSLSQRLLGRLNLTVSSGYSTSDYQSSSIFFDADRLDTRRSLSVSLGTRFLQRASASVSYTRVSNDSSLNGFTYDSNQYSLRLGYSF